MSSPAPFNDVKAKLEAANLGYPIAWPNEKFDRPQAPSTWLHVEITSSVLVPIELGADVWQEEGTAYITVLVPKGSGSDTARTIAKTIANLFRGLGPEDVVYLGAAIGNGSIAGADGVYWPLTVAVDWRYQDLSA